MREHRVHQFFFRCLEPFFIIDTGVAKPGTQGSIWIDDVSLY